MNDETRKRLTLFIGECWHEYSDQFGSGNTLCRKCGIFGENRTFSPPDDAQEVKDKLVEKGLWQEFYAFVYKKVLYRFGEGLKDEDAFVSNWLWSYTRDSAGNVTGYRLCDLAGEFMEVGK